MNGRDRLVAAARGGDIDRQPAIYWPGPPDQLSDALVMAPERVQQTEGEGRILLGEVLSPFGLAAQENLQLTALLEQDPAKGNDLLEQLTQRTRQSMQLALTNGADGILYRLHGAHPSCTSPMQYGGYYLERDRELLEEIQGTRFNLLFIAGGEGAYIDFVSDLPAHAFAWDERSSGVALAEVRRMRSGALATTSAGADIRLISPYNDLTSYLETYALAAV